MNLRRQPDTAMVVLQDADGRTSRRCVNLRDLDSTMQRHVASGGYAAVSGFREGRAPIHALAPPTARTPRRTAEPSTAEVPTPSASRSLERGVETPEATRGPTYMRASVGQGVAAHDAFATAGQRYDNVAATDPVGNAEGHISTLLTGHPIPTTTGTAWDLRMPDGSIGKATADHVVEDDWLHRKVANDPANDFAVVSGSGDSGLELASQDAQPGDPVAIVSAREGVIHANALGHRPTQPDGHPNSFDALVVNKPVKGGTSGSPIVQLAEGPDKGKVVGVVSCGDETETAGAPASTMRQAIGGPVSDGQNSTIPSTTMPADMSHDTVQHGLSL